MHGAWVLCISMKNNSNADLHTGAKHKTYVNALKHCIRPVCEREDTADECNQENNRRGLKHINLRSIITAIMVVLCDLISKCD